MSFFDSFKSFWGVLALAAAAGPLGMIAPGLHPPWPTGGSTVAVIFSACALALGRRYATRMRGGGSRVSTMVVISGVVLLIVYLALFSVFVIEEQQLVDGRRETLRFVVGYERTPELSDSRRRDLDLLRDSLYRPEEVWTRGSLLVVRLLLLVTFCLAFAFLAYGSALMSRERVAEADEPEPRRRGR